ncbi:MAG: DUF1566 domain-containing protein [Methylomicrobium sp.]|nr:DUF1566 domain-containing protein [Methylomicrobium sp.]
MAQHTALGHAVAIKEYFPDGLAFRLHQTQQVQAVSQGQQTFYRQGLQRFLQEGQVLAGLRHPNIVRILDFMEANGTAYLVMDYEHGETLQTYLDRIDKPLSYQESMQLLLPVLDGLREVHKHQLLHLDIKPDNIFLRHNSTAMLIDFGGARQFVGSQSKSVSFMVNSAGYSPPEQYSAEPLQGVYSDIYSLSATFYRCLSGSLPTPANTRSQALLEGDRDPLPSAMSIGRGQYPNHFLQGIDQGLLLNRKQRPENVRLFQYLLQGKESGKQSVQTYETVSGPQSLDAESFDRSDTSAPKKRFNEMWLIAGFAVSLAFAHYLNRADVPLLEEKKVEAGGLIADRYRDNGDGTVTDITTGLQWMRCSLGQTWQNQTCVGEAKNYSFDDAIDAGRQTVFAGHRDWRVPTIDELKTLIYCSSGLPKTWNYTGDGCKGDHQIPTIRLTAFPDAPEWFVWSSSSYFSGFALLVYFSDGGVSSGRKVNSARVRLVRGGQ